jgi:transcriptional regulator with PAS, ATPase and Fis domain
LEENKNTGRGSHIGFINELTFDLDTPHDRRSTSHLDLRNKFYSWDPLMINLLDQARLGASTRAPVLILGETGSGKEMVARYIHAKSLRAHEKFVAVNCAAIPDNLLETDLFGHERGSFTGATSRHIGKFELANDGSMLLDEISEMNIQLQSKLLRVIQEREITRLGSNCTLKVDTRIIATTNRNMTT